MDVPRLSNLLHNNEPFSSQARGADCDPCITVPVQDNVCSTQSVAGVADMHPESRDNQGSVRKLRTSYISISLTDLQLFFHLCEGALHK